MTDDSLEVTIVEGNRVGYIRSKHASGFPVGFTIKIHFETGVVQAGNRSGFLPHNVLGVGDEAGWMWGDYEITVKRVSDRMRKIVPFGELKQRGREQ